MGKRQIGLAARPASRSNEGRRRRHTAAEASPVFANLATQCVVCGTTSRPIRPEPWFPARAGRRRRPIGLFARPASPAEQGIGPRALLRAASGALAAPEPAATPEPAAEARNPRVARLSAPAKRCASDTECRSSSAVASRTECGSSTPEAATPERLLVRTKSGSVDETAALATKQEPPQPAASTRPCRRSASWNSAAASESIPPRAPRSTSRRRVSTSTGAWPSSLHDEPPQGLHAKSPFPER